LTPEELEIFRLKVQLEALRVIVRALFLTIAKSSTTGPQILQDRFDDLRREHGKIMIPGLRPGYSDMLSAEYQEALKDLLSFIESGLGSKSTP
jgi:hypothetical protein